MYREFVIEHGGYYDQVAIGVQKPTCNSLSPLSYLLQNNKQFVGYEPDSIGWHGVLGFLYISGHARQQLPLFQTDETVGIGILESKTLFLTLNGAFISKIALEASNNL